MRFARNDGPKRHRVPKNMIAFLEQTRNGYYGFSLFLMI